MVATKPIALQYALAAARGAGQGQLATYLEKHGHKLTVATLGFFESLCDKLAEAKNS